MLCANICYGPWGMEKRMGMEDEKRAEMVFDPLLREFDFMLVGKILTEIAR